MFNWLFKNHHPVRGPGPIGLLRDADFAPREPSIWGRLFARGSDGRTYWIDEQDARRLRPIVIRDPRAVANERAKVDRLERLRRAGAPLVFDEFSGEYELAPPRAQLLPPAPRGQPQDPYEGDFIIFPDGAGDGNPGR
jgi:hypothetical protein